MKINELFLIFIAALFLANCSSGKKLSYENLLKKEFDDCRVKEHKIFLVLKSGDTILGKKIRASETKSKITLDGKTYSDNEVDYFQDKNEYQAVNNGRYMSYMRRGKLSVLFYNNYYPGVNTLGIEHRMIFEKGQGNFFEANKKNLKMLIEDNEAALLEFNKIYADPKSEVGYYFQLKSVVDLYNN